MVRTQEASLVSRYATELAKMFDDDILPIIGGLEIQDIEPMQLLEVIRRFEDCGAIEVVNKNWPPS